MKAYYNEHDKFAAAWLRELIKAKLIADGDVDERDIQEVKGTDLDGYTQVHFFAGIGGWSYALRLAGWPDDRPVWTGSCPCQDFSNAGERDGFAGDRDHWPSMRRLIEECSPDIVFGEQVDDAPEWWDRTAADLEILNYTCGACVVPACAVDAIHERGRLFFFAHSMRFGGTGPIQTVDSGSAGSWGPRGQADLHAVIGSPFLSGRSWPAPLLRSCDDGVSGRVDILRGAGNSIVPQLACEFIQASIEAINEQGES